MAATWTSQTQKSSTSSGTRERTAWLRPFRATFVQAIVQYFREEPDGEQVTLACLRAIGPENLRDAGARIGRGTMEVKMDAGLYVPILLVELAGADNVFTYRDDQTGKNSTRPRSSRWVGLEWVSSYTPHKVSEAGLLRMMEGRA